MIFDSHAHMDTEEFNEDRAEVLERVHSGKISYVLNPGVDLTSSQNAVKLAEDYPWIYAAVGYHPQETRYLSFDILEELEKLAAHPKVKAIGEIGLDYHWDRTPHDVQQFWFRQQIRLAEKLELPKLRRMCGKRCGDGSQLRQIFKGKAVPSPSDCG